MSRSKMLLPFLLMLCCWSISWVRLTMGGSSCPAECTCWWKGNKETVECANKALVALPAGIDADTQVVNISDNNLQQLTRDTFLRANLLNLQRIYMASCNIGTIQEGAFHRLSNLVELDLSRNLLPEVPTLAFRDIPALRRLILSQNPILRLDNNAFQLLPSLVDLQLSQCHLEAVAPKAFHGLRGLTHLKLDGNRLTSLSGKVIQPLRGLHGVALHGNPWKCDCGMREVKLWLTRFNIPYKLPPACAQPARVKGYTLDELQLDDLACAPRSVYSNRRSEVVIGRNASLVCEVSADPSPNIRWFRQGHPVANLTRFFQGVKMYVIYERAGSGSGSADKVSVLTITAVSEQDAGDYLCVAENKAGSFAANFTLQVLFRDLEASGLTSGQIAGISLGLILVGAIVLLLICILLAKWRQAGLLGSDLKHPPLNQSQHKLVNSTANHVHDYGKKGGQVKMSFSLPRLSRSSSAQRNYSDEAASDSDRTLVENLTSPSKSSTCNLSNKPDVVNVQGAPPSPQQRNSRSSSSSASSKKDKGKKEKRQDKKQKEKRKERHRWKPEDDAKTAPEADSNRETTTQEGSAQQEQEEHRKSEDSNRCNSTTALSKDFRKEEDSNRYDLKLSASNEWNKVISGGDAAVDNAGFAREGAGQGRGESYELIEKGWANHCAALQDAAPPGGDKTMASNDVAGCNSSSSLNRNSSAARFRHYVPVLPPLPAQHYSQVRNSLIRSCKGDSAEDITDM